MEFRNLRYFVAAAETGHFGRAAKRLRISQPGLSVAIKELERELGVELFTRLPRGVRLSHSGKALLEQAQAILKNVEQAAEYVQRVEHGHAGVLRIGHVSRMRLSPTGVDSIIPAFCVRYPDVDVQSVSMTVAEQCAAVDDGSIDVGIGYAPSTKTSTLRFEAVEQTALDGVLVPSGHALARQERVRCRDLNEVPQLRALRSDNPHAYDAITRELRARGLTLSPESARHISDATIRFGLVAAGGGWMLASESMIPVLLANTSDVVFRKLADPPIVQPWCIIWRAEDRSAVVANFLAIARQVRDAQPERTVADSSR